MLLVIIPNGRASTATYQFHGHFKAYLYLVNSAHFSIYFTLQTHIPFKPFKISMQALLHTFIPPKLLILSFLTPPLYIGSNRSHHVSCLSYFRTTYFITPLSGYHAPISPLHSNISASILSLVIYQLFRHLTCSYLTQPIFDNASLLLVIPFTSIKNMKKGPIPSPNRPPSP